MNLFCAGLSHHVANVETRERFAGHAETECVLRRAGCSEVLLLSTCNRVEVYAVSDTVIGTDEISRCLFRGSEHAPGDNFAEFYRHEGAECARHLFRVASGLDSMVVGETEILGQTKKAYESARKSGTAGSYLHRLFQRAFRVAKQVRTHTEITRGAVSVGSVAVELAEKIFGDLANCKVMILGAGETSERTARALVSRGVTDLRVSNRSAGRGVDLVNLVGGRAINFHEWPEQCREIDILITSTASEMPLLGREKLESILQERTDRPLFIIDIAVPRDVEPDVNALDGVYLYDIDSLQSIAEQTLALRRQQVSKAESIIAQHVAAFQESISFGLTPGERTREHPIAESNLRPSEL